MTNIIIPGECIKNKKEAEKCLKDHDASFMREGWREHEEKRDKVDKKCDQACYDVLKANSYGKYIGFNWKPGQWEKIFGKGEGRETTKDEN